MQKLSIIIPCYNSAFSLRTLLDSILCECDNTQIVVVDDNSDKDISELDAVRSEYADRVEFYTNDSGVKGAGAARNVGQLKSLGDWLLYADADDYFVSGWYKAISQYMESEYDLIFFNVTSSDVKSGNLSDRHIKFSHMVSNACTGNNEDLLYLKYFHVAPWGKLVKACVIRNNNILSETVMYSNDVMLSTKISAYSLNAVADDTVIYCVTAGGNSLTANINEDIFRIRHIEFGKRCAFLKEHISEKEYEFIKYRLGITSRIDQAKKLGYSRESIREYINIYKNYNVPYVELRIYEYKCLCKEFVKKLIKYFGFFDY